MSEEQKPRSFIYLKKDAHILRIASDSSLALELPDDGYKKITAEEYWGAQSPATLRHFLELDAIDPTALATEEEPIVNQLAEAASNEAEAEA